MNYQEANRLAGELFGEQPFDVSEHRAQLEAAILFHIRRVKGPCSIIIGVTYANKGSTSRDEYYKKLAAQMGGEPWVHF